MKKMQTWILRIFLCLLLSFVMYLLSVLLPTLEENQSLKTEFYQITEEMLSARNNNEQLRQLLDSSYENFTIIKNENYQLNLLLNATLCNITLLSNENVLLSERFDSTLQEKTQLQVENMLLNATVDSYKLVQEKKQQLIVLLNTSLHHITVASAEKERLSLLLNNESKTYASLVAINQQQLSILFSNQLSFIWSLCNKDTLQCSPCLSGWVEHASRCFLLQQKVKNWEDGRRDCHDMQGDLAVVLNAEDQAFLTKMTFQFLKQHPQENLQSAWIGLQDMVKESIYIWSDGSRVKPDVTYWRRNEPNNAIASWDIDKAGQDCVAIVPPQSLESRDWLRTWDDLHCREERHYLCEMPVFILP